MLLSTALPGQILLAGTCKPVLPPLDFYGVQVQDVKVLQRLKPLKLPECSAKGRSSQSSSYIGAR